VVAIAAVPSSPAHHPPASSSDPPLTDRQLQAADAYAKLPVSFVENHGQTDAAVRYYAQGNRFAFYMTPSEVLMSFLDRPSSSGAQSPLGQALALRFVGSDPLVEPRGAEKAPGVVNDLRGSDPSKWHTGIPQFRDGSTATWARYRPAPREQSGVLAMSSMLPRAPRRPRSSWRTAAPNPRRQR
jgi:hypothetical protein